MICYKLYMSIDQVKPGSEEKLKVQCLASQYFEAFTIYNSVNFWLDKHERGLTLEVISGMNLSYHIAGFVGKLKFLIGQDKILVTSHEIIGDYI